MPRYYLRVDAVNLKNFVYDTNDISTIRGGSLILLEAIKSLREQFSAKLDSISTAASMGIFVIRNDAPEKDELQEIANEVLHYLNDYSKGHATFVVAIEPEAEEGFPLTLKKLEAQIHRQQWRLPTVAIPQIAVTKQECHIDGWRPGVEDYRVDPAVTNERISAATHYRRKQGRQLKHKLLPFIVGQNSDDDEKKDICAKDLGKLSQLGKKGVLNGKIAVIHADGNSFGKIRHNMCQAREDREEFDEKIQIDFHARFLNALLKYARDDEEFRTKDEYGQKAHRLEVLLWGGDEMTLVVPAWKAWQTVELFYQHAKDLAFKEVPLTHCMALIFCHHNAPILQIRGLAEKLLGQAKQDISKSIPSHNEGDALHYLALESFDMLQGEFDDFLKRYYKKIDYGSLLLRASELDTIHQNLRIIRQNVARSKLFEIINAIRNDKVRPIDTIKERIGELLIGNNRQETEAAIEALTKNNPAGWYLITDLWDYIPEWK